MSTLEHESCEEQITRTFWGFPITYTRCIYQISRWATEYRGKDVKTRRLYGWLATFLQATWMNGRTMCWLTSHWLIRSPQITRRPSLVLGYSTLGQVQIGHWILSFTRKLLQQTPRFPLALPCVIHFARSDNPSFCSLSILFLFCQLEKQRNNLQRK